MQNAYTVLRGWSELKNADASVIFFPLAPLILRVSEPIGTASGERVIDFYRYITVFGEHVGWEFLDDLMGDPERCGALYCDVGLRNARVAQQYMVTLATVQPRFRGAKRTIYR